MSFTTAFRMQMAAAVGELSEKTLITWSGTNGLDITPTLTYANTDMHHIDEMRVIHDTPLGDVGFIMQYNGHCTNLYSNVGGSITTPEVCALEGYFGNQQLSDQDGQLGTWKPSQFKYTTDGTTWTQGVGPSGLMGEYRNLTYWPEKSKWYIIDYDTIWASNTTAGAMPSLASHWTQVYTADQYTNGNPLNAITTGDLVHNGTSTNYCIAVGDKGATAYSTDGTSFTKVQLNSYGGSSGWNHHNFDFITIAEGSAFVSPGRMDRAKICTLPTGLAEDGVTGGWDTMDSTDAHGTGAYKMNYLDYLDDKVVGYNRLTGFHFQSVRPLETTTVADIHAGTTPWTAIFDEDVHPNNVGVCSDPTKVDQQQCESVSGVWTGNLHGMIGGIQQGNGHFFMVGMRAGVNQYVPSQQGFNYDSGSYNPYYAYSLDNMATWTFANQGFTGTLTMPHRLIFINGLFVAADKWASPPIWETVYPASGAGNSQPYREHHDTDKDLYSTPGIEGDEVTVTFDPSLASSPISYYNNPGSDSPLENDKSLYTALQKAITDGDLTGVTVAYNGGVNNGSGVECINTDRAEVTNITIAGASSTANVQTYVDND